MKYIILILFSLPAQADYWFAEIGIGNNTNLTGCSICWDDGGGMGAILSGGYVWEHDNDVFVKAFIFHDSQWDVGPPWNDDDESSLDFIGLSIQKRWY